MTGEVVTPFCVIYPRWRMLDVGERKECMKTADKMMIIAMIPFGIFVIMFVGAIIGEIRGSMSVSQVRAIAQWSLLPLVLTAIIFIPACLMPDRTRPN